MSFFLVFEGPEGSGKSTQARAIAELLERDGHPVLQTREPGGTDISERVRTILLDQAAYAMLPETEALLYAAARAQLVGEKIRPALAAGRIVVCDRFVDSSLAYQVGGRGLPLAEVQAIQRLATRDLQPDLRILLDLPVRAGLARRFADHQHVNRLDVADIAFHERVRACYLGLARQDPPGWFIIDAERTADQIAAQIADVVRDRLNRGNSNRPVAAQHGGGA